MAGEGGEANLRFLVPSDYLGADGPFPLGSTCAEANLLNTRISLQKLKIN
jgi:hypothetical protein